MGVTLWHFSEEKRIAHVSVDFFSLLSGSFIPRNINSLGHRNKALHTRLHLSLHQTVSPGFQGSSLLSLDLQFLSSAWYLVNIE